MMPTERELQIVRQRVKSLGGEIKDYMREPYPFSHNLNFPVVGGAFELNGQNVTRVKCYIEQRLANRGKIKVFYFNDAVGPPSSIVWDEYLDP